MKKAMTLLQATKDFFGLLTMPSGAQQTGMEFAKEYKALTPADREEIKAGLEQQGYTIIASSPAMMNAVGNVGSPAMA